MRKFGFLFWLICILPGTALAEYPTPPIEAYGALPSMSDAEISPDGRRIAAISHNAQGSFVLVIDIASGEVTNGGALGEIKARDVEFYDDEHVILRVSKTVKTYGFRGEYEYDAAFSMNLSNNKIKQLMHRTRGLFPAQSGIGRFVGRSDRPGEVLMPAYVGTAYGTPTLDLFRAKLGSNVGKKHTKGNTHTRDWFVDDRGAVLARILYNNKSNEFQIQRRDGKKWIEIYSEETNIPYSIHGVTLDESGLVFSQVEADDAGNTALMKIGFDGSFHGPIVPLRDREIERVITDVNRKVIGVQYAGVVPDYAFLDTELQSSFATTTDALPNATVYIDSWSDDKSVVLYRVFDPSLGDVWLTHHRSTESFSVVSRRRPDVPVEALAVMMDINYPARDGLQIQAILSAPPNYKAGESPPMPTIVLPHGGPSDYDRFDFDWMAQFFANRGYLVLQPNYRGSAGFGQSFEDAGRGEWGGKMQHDITDGINALINAEMIDEDRICIVGSSYGGYAALAGAVFTPDLYKCVIAIAPVADLNRMLRDEKRERGRHHWVVSYWENIMADGDARRNKLKSISPAQFAGHVSAPVLLLHGDDDTVVPIDQSKLMERALRRTGKQVQLITLRGEDHWLSGADTRMQTLREMDRFIAEHLPLE